MAIKPAEKPVDEALRGRLRLAILAEDGDEKQLDGVMRMLGEKRLLGEKSPDDQLPLFGKAPRDRRPA